MGGNNADMLMSNESLVGSVFKSLPTVNEVEKAIASLQSFVVPLKQSKALPEGMMTRVDSMLESPGFQIISHAIKLLQTVQPVKTMVTSLVTDESFVTAVKNNSEVNKFQRSFKHGNNNNNNNNNNTEGSRGCYSLEEQKMEDADLLSIILKWVLDAKNQVMEFVQVLKSMLSKNSSSGTMSSPMSEKLGLGEKIGSSLLLSVIVLLIVLVDRVCALGSGDEHSI